MLYIKRLLLIFVSILLSAPLVLAQKNIPDKERYIFLWDVSGSLLPNKVEMDWGNNKPLKTNSNGNGLWNKLKESLVNSIDCIDVNEQSEIIVIPFYAQPLDEFRENANKEGKEKIKNRIKNFKYPDDVEQRTDLLEALKRFEEIVKDDCLDYINYMYFYTDGAHETVINKPEFDYKKVIDRINKFNKEATAPGRYIYRFYYLASSAADPDGKIREQESDTNKFWVVDSLVDVKHIGLKTTTIIYNVCDNPNENIKRDVEKIINFRKDYGSYKGKIVFTPQENDYYDVNCKISNDASSLVIEVIPKKGVDSLPKEKEIIVNAKLEKDERDKNQKYYYLLDHEFKIKCINTPQRCVSLSLKNTKEDKSSGDKRLDLGKTSYYPPFMGNSDKLNCLNFSLSIDFNKYAIQDKACLDVSFADSKGEPLSYTDFKIVVNKVDTLSPTECRCPIQSNQKRIDFEILPSKAADDFKFKGCLIVSQMRNIDRINGEAICHDKEVQILPWKFEHDRNWNPLLKKLLWIIVLLVLLFAAICLAFIARAHFAPRFPSGCKIAFAPPRGGDFDAETDHNFELVFKQIAEGILVGDINAPAAKSNTINTHILKESYIQKIVLSTSDKAPIQTFIQEKWNGRIIYVVAEFHTQSISSIELIPIRYGGYKKDAKVIVKYSNRSHPLIERIGLANLDNQHTTTNNICIPNTRVGVEGRRVTYN